MGNIPPQIRRVEPFLKRAEELEKAKENPVYPYYCRLFAVNEAMNNRGALQPNHKKEVEKFIVQQLDQLEKDKAKMPDGTLDDGPEAFEMFAMDMFQRADDEDRRGNPTKGTALKFKVAAEFLEVCTQFESFSNDMAEKRKYAKWKVADIIKAIKEGRKPQPGGPGEEFQPSTEIDGGGGGDEDDADGDDDADDGAPPTSGGSAAPSYPTPTSSTSKAPASAVSDEAIQKAKKHAKFAISSLDYKDVEGAIADLKDALACLEG